MAWPGASGVIRRALAWLEDRTGLGAIARQFLFEQIPRSSGWAQVFGIVVLSLFALQVVTGILLSFNYAPVPGDAYNSVRYIATQVAGGRFIRGLHHWGASAMIVAVVLHMLQVFLYGAYKKPREVTWVCGVFLLLLTLGFGLTGYLLPWDNRAYWGSVVTTQIASKMPVVGDYAARLLGSTGAIGVATFARFFALHVMVLPAAAALLISLHLYLVRRHGVTPQPNDDAPRVAFFPSQAAKDTTAVLVAFAILAAMAAFVSVPLEKIADPTDVNAVPRPEWYFLFLFQTLKAFQGSLEVVGTAVLPALAVLLLLLVPFLDRTAPDSVRHRKTAWSIAAACLMGWAALTVAAIVTTPSSAAPSLATLPAASGWRHLSPEELAGIGYFRSERCSTCHNLSDGEPKTGPNLAAVAERKPAAWMIAHFRNPPQLIPGSSMPPIHLADSQLNTLAAFLLRLDSTNAAALEAAPAFATEGAQIYEASGCGACHMVNGAGMRVGPELNGLAGRRSRDWVVRHFADPPALSPGSAMPPFKFSAPDMKKIVDYLMSL